MCVCPACLVTLSTSNSLSISFVRVGYCIPGVHDVSYTTRFVHPTFRIQIIKILTFRIQALLNIVYR